MKNVIYILLIMVCFPVFGQYKTMHQGSPVSHQGVTNLRVRPIDIPTIADSKRPGKGGEGETTEATPPTTYPFLDTIEWAGDVWYVDGNAGSDGNSGTSKAQAWETLSHALGGTTGVGADDSIYVNAADYGSEQITISVSGSPMRPIVVYGTGQNWNLDVKDDWTYGDTHDATEMPYFNRATRTSGRVINLSSSPWMTFKNFQISGFAYSVYVLGSPNCWFENFYCTEMGALDYHQTSNGFQILGNRQEQVYPEGTGVKAHSDSCVVKNVTMVNSTGVGIESWSDYVVIDSCEVYCDDGSTAYSAMDYYIVTVGMYDTIRNCLVHRIGDIPHHGHGIGTRGVWYANQGYNVFEWNTARYFSGESFYSANQNCTHNTFRYNTVITGSEGLVCRDGSNYNTWEYNTLDSVGATPMDDPGDRAAISMRDFYEQGEEWTGKYNTYRYNVIKNSEVAIAFWSPNDYVSSEADSNYFYNNVFYNCDTLIRIEEPNEGNEFKNNIFLDVDNYSSNSSFTDNLLFEYNDFFSGFTARPGTGNITSDPSFTDAAGGDFTLQTGSDCIDAGTDVGLPYNGSAPDMGAEESE